VQYIVFFFIVVGTHNLTTHSLLEVIKISYP